MAGADGMGECGLASGGCGGGELPIILSLRAKRRRVVEDSVRKNLDDIKDVPEILRRNAPLDDNLVLTDNRFPFLSP